MVLDVHCMQIFFHWQTAQAVKEIAYKPIPFANGDFKRINEFRRVSQRSRETAFNARRRVLHGFSCSILEVRKVGTSKRTSGDIMRKQAIQGVQKTRV